MRISLRLITIFIVPWFGLAAATVKATPIPYPNSGTIDTHIHTFTATGTGPIGAYFYGSTANYTNTLSLLVNGSITPESSAGLLNNQTSGIGDFVVLGYANAGDVLTFQLNVLSSEETWYSNESLNADGINHIYSTSFSGDTTHSIPNGTYVGFEDLYNGGDSDYDDETFIFTNISHVAAPVSPVPEPEAYAMLLIGLGLIAFAARHRKTD